MKTTILLTFILLSLGWFTIQICAQPCNCGSGCCTHTTSWWDTQTTWPSPYETATFCGGSVSYHACIHDVTVCAPQLRQWIAAILNHNCLSPAACYPQNVSVTVSQFQHLVDTCTSLSSLISATSWPGYNTLLSNYNSGNGVGPGSCP